MNQEKINAALQDQLSELHAQTAVHECVLMALISCSPDRTALAKAFEDYYQRTLALFLPSQLQEQSIEYLHSAKQVFDERLRQKP